MRYLPIHEWRKKAIASSVLKTQELRESGVSIPGRLEKAADSDTDKRALTFVLSDESIDRHGDIIRIDGWDIAQYKANPVMLWGHDQSSLPIARATDVWVEGKRLMARAEFPTADVSQFADRVYRMFVDGFLSAVSIGGIPLDWDYDRDADIFVIKQIELLEFSAVAVPANPNALISREMQVSGKTETKRYEPYLLEAEIYS